MRSRSEDIAAAIKTYQLVGESVARSDARFEGEVQASFVQSLRQAFSKSQEELWAFLRQVGIVVAPERPDTVTSFRELR
jgi:hypothetical protein